MRKRLLSLDGIDVSLGGRSVLKNVTLELCSGEVIALVGPNGAGKTTLLRIASGLLLPQNGKVLLEETLLDSLSSRQRAQNIAIVFQNTPQEFGFTGVDIVSMGRNPYVGAWTGLTKKDTELIEGALRRVGVSDLANRRINELSGGEQQLFYLARAIAQEPRVLILDEPTANLDVRFQIQMMNIVRSVAQGGAGVMMVTHNINQAVQYADRVAFMKNGELVKIGAKGDFTIDTLSSVFGTSALKFENNGDTFFHFK